MELKWANGQVGNPDDNQIASVLQGLEDGLQNYFAILTPEPKELKDTHFLQTSYAGINQFIVEYKDSLEERQYQSMDLLPLEKVIAIFQAYRRGDSAWKGLVVWEDITSELEAAEIEHTRRVKESQGIRSLTRSAFWQNSSSTFNIELKSDGEGGWVKIEGLGFFDSFSYSPDGRLVLAWQEHYYPTGPRHFVLLDTLDNESDLRIFKCTKNGIQQPAEGTVSNKGVFILNDNHGAGRSSEGVLCAFSPDGNMILSQKFKSFLGENGISDDGKFAFCVTNENLEICLFDLEQKMLISKFKPMAIGLRRPREYNFDTGNKILHLIYDENLTHRYSFRGCFLDIERREADQLYLALTSRHGYELMDIAFERLQRLNSHILESYSFEIALIISALTKGVSPNTQAQVYRKLGEIYHRCGETNQAIKHLEQALSLNPNVGVKKLVKRIKNFS